MGITGISTWLGVVQPEQPYILPSFVARSFGDLIGNVFGTAEGPPERSSGPFIAGQAYTTSLERAISR